MNVYDILLAKKLAGGGVVTPTGNINITDTAVTDVAAYATAQVVDGNLVADNIKKDVDILGVTGTYEGGGGGAQPQRDVNFIDYDGTILHSYTAAEFAALTAMPDNPDHSSDIQWGGHTIPLTSQGWNWSLADAKAYVAAYGKLWIGQMYVPTDGKLHLCVRMGEGRLNPASRFSFTGTATIDWGDGTDPVAAVSKQYNTHTYAAAGDYDVTISVSEGRTLDIKGYTYSSSPYSYLFGQNTASQTLMQRAYACDVHKVFVSGNVTNIGEYAFAGMGFMLNVTIPNSVTSIGKQSFRTCYDLRSVTIPNGVSSIFDYAFEYCYALKNVAIPSSVTSVIGHEFYYCNQLQGIALPNGITSITEYMFESCCALQHIMIPASVTSIGITALKLCVALQHITIPASVTSIGANAFAACSVLRSIYFEAETPPTVSNSNAWGIASNCIIYVPSASLDAYKTATNYPDPSTYTYVGY